MTPDIFYYFPQDKQYVAANPGLRVPQDFSSGYFHFRKYGRAEGRKYNEASLFLTFFAIGAAVIFGAFKLIPLLKRKTRRR